MAAEADAAGIPVVRANRLGPVTDELVALNADLGVIVAYGGLVREPLLSAPRLGWVNLHFSLLPRWRGAAPVQRAIIAGDQETGASVFQLVPDLDAGDVFAMESRPIGRNQTAGHLLDSLAASGAGLLARVVDQLADGTAVATPQTGEPTSAPKLMLDDGRLDWTQDAVEVDARVRGVTPEPGAFTMVDDGRLKVHVASIAHDVPRLEPGRIEERGGRVYVGTGTVPLELLEVQPAGKRAMPAADWWRGLDGSAVVAR